jgi:hypothetical protein
MGWGLQVAAIEMAISFKTSTACLTLCQVDQTSLTRGPHVSNTEHGLGVAGSSDRDGYLIQNLGRVPRSVLGRPGVCNQRVHTFLTPNMGWRVQVEMAISSKTWAACLALCALLLVGRPAAGQTGKCASTYTTATGNTATIVANNCGCSTQAAFIASTNNIAAPSTIIAANTLLRLPNACVSSAPAYTPQVTTRNTFTPQATTRNVFTPQVTTRTNFTLPKYLTDETEVPVPQPLPNAEG